MTTLLQLIQQVSDELGINRPSLVIGTTDPQTRQMLALLNRLGKDLCRQNQWQRLDKEHILITNATTLTGTTVAGSSQVTVTSTSGLSSQWGISGVGIEPFAQIVTVDNATQFTMTMPATASGTVDLTLSQVQYDLPSDWSSQIPQTEWDRTNRWPLMGPQSAQDWQSFKSGIVYAGPRERFRILGQTITINPMPPDGLVFAFEYISNGWVNSSGTYLNAFATDSDTTIFEDTLLITGLKAQWKAAKGFDNTYDLAEFTAMLETCKAQDKSAPKLSLAPNYTDPLLTLNNIPDGNWPA